MHDEIERLAVPQPSVTTSDEATGLVGLSTAWWSRVWGTSKPATSAPSSAAAGAGGEGGAKQPPATASSSRSTSLLGRMWGTREAVPSA